MNLNLRYEEPKEELEILTEDSYKKLLNQSLPETIKQLHGEVPSQHKATKEKEPRKQARTPSGIVISTPVSDIRKFFSPDNSQKSDKTVDIVNVHEHVHRFEDLRSTAQLFNTSRSDNFKVSSTPLPKRESKQISKERKKQLLQKASTAKVLNMSTEEDSKKRKHNSHSDESADLSMLAGKEIQQTNDQSLTLDVSGQREMLQSPLISENTNPQDVKNKRYRVDQNKNQTLQKIQDTTNQLSAIDIDEDKIDSIDIRTVLAMFNKTKRDMETIKQQFSDRLDTLTEGDKLKVSMDDDLQKSFDHYDTQIKTLSQELQAANKKMNLMSDILLYNRQITEDVMKRLDTIEISNAKKTAVLSGLSFSIDKSSLIQEIKDLFADVLHVQSEIDDAYTLGNKTSAPVVIQFPSITAKKRVFKNKSKLDTIQDPDGQKVYLSNYLLSAANDSRMRINDLVRKCKAENPGTKIQTEYSKTAIKINGQSYKKAVCPPQPTDLLELSVEELDNILAIKTKKADEINKHGNRLIAYGLDTSSHSTIREAYLKLRLIHPKARHIVCVFNLPHTGFQYHDYCDDGDFGVGRQILKIMEESDITSKAIFIVRYAGEKLDQDRFPTYIEAVEKLFYKYPYNMIEKKNQYVRLQNQQTDQQQITGAPAKSKTTDNNLSQRRSGSLFASLFNKKPKGLKQIANLDVI